jgi:hypothetical protein
MPFGRSHTCLPFLTPKTSLPEPAVTRPQATRVSGLLAIPAHFRSAAAWVYGLSLLLLISAFFCSVAVAQTAHFSGAVTIMAGAYAEPYGVAVDGSGDVFVANLGYGTVQEIPAGCTASACIVTVASGLYVPEGIAVDGSGNVFITNGYATVQEIPAGCGSSACIRTVGGGFSNSLHNLAVDKSGNVYVADVNNNAVKVIPPGCTSSSCVNTLGSGFAEPYGVAVDGNGDVFVADTDNSKVKEILAGCTSSACTINTLGSGFDLPMGVAVDSSGNVFVADWFNNEVKEIVAAGGYTVVETLGSGFNGPESVAVDGNENVLVADAYNNAVKEIGTLSGNFGTVNVGAASPQTIQMNFTFDTAGKLGSTAVLTQGAPSLDFTDAGGDTCSAGTSYSAGNTCIVNVTFKPARSGVRYGATTLNSTSGAVIATGYVVGTGSGPQVTFGPGIQSTLGGGLSAALGLAADSSGDIFVADNFHSAVKEIPPGCTSSACVKTLGSGFDQPDAVAVDGAGNIFVADGFNNAVKEILAAGGYTTVKTIANNIPTPKGIAVDASGNVFVSNWNNQLQEIVAAGGYTTIKTLASGFKYLDGLKVDGSGNVFVTDFYNNTVDEIPAAGGYTTVKTIGGSFVFNQPMDVALDGNGNVFVANYGAGYAGAVEEIPAAGGYTTVNTITSGISYLDDVAVDGSGNLFLAIGSGNGTDIGTVEKWDRADPPSLSFAVTGVGSTTYPQDVTFTNIGNATLTLPVPSTGDNPSITANFTLDSTEAGTCPLVSSSSSAPETLAAGASCVLPISFSPLSPGIFIGSLMLTDNALNAPAPGYATQTIQLSGTGVQTTPTITWATPLPIPYGTALSATQLDATTTVPGTFVYSPAVGTVLPLGGNILSVTFTPTDTVGYTTATASVALTVFASSGTINIGSSASTATSLPFTFATATTLDSINVVTQGATGLDFTNAGTGTCTVGTNYAAGATCTVNVTFTPRFAGFRYGAAILEDGSGNVLATDYVSGTGSGPEVNFWPGSERLVGNGMSSPWAVAADGNGNLYIADSGNNRVLKETLAWLTGIYTQSVVPTSTLSNPQGVAVDGSGNVYIADFGNNRVLKETLSGTTYTESSVGSGLSKPSSVAVDGSGNVYILDTAPTETLQILKETLSAGSYTPSQLYSGSWYITGVAADGNGSVYFSKTLEDEMPGSGGVFELTPTSSGYTTSTLDSTLNAVAVAVDGNDNVYTIDQGTYGPYSVIEETPSSGYNENFLPIYAALSNSSGVAVDGFGDVYITDAGGSLLLKQDFFDTPSLSFAATKVGSTSSDSPQTITFENAGNATLTFPIPNSGNNPSISTNFTLDSSDAGTCPLVSAGSSTAATLAAGASCTLPISFSPTTVGTILGFLALTDNARNAAAPNYATQAIPLIGTGTQGTPTITWATPAPIPYGTTLGGILNATAQSGSKPVAGSFAYTATPAGGTAVAVTAATILAPGSYTLTANFTPTDTTDYTTATATVQLTVNPDVPAAMMSPTPGTVLAGSTVTFTWTAGYGPAAYQLYLGTTGVGSHNLYESGATKATTVTVTGLPTYGVTVFARLWWEIGAAWLSADYTYTESGTPVLPVLTTPAPGSVLSGSSVTFTWTAGGGPASYQLWLGTTGVGSQNLYDSGATTVTTETVSGLPANGAPVYARLWWEVSGVWKSADYIYFEAGTPVPPGLITPVPGRILSGSTVTFAWTPSAGVTDYQLWLGATGVGSQNLYNSGATKATTVTVSGLPTNGVTLYARLWWEVSGVWTSADYTYTEAGTPVLPVLTTPTPGSVLSGSSVAFTWTAGTGPVAYQLYLGTTGVGSHNLYESGSTTATTVTVNNVPTYGVKVYARLWWEIDAAWKSADYTYTEAGSPVSPVLTTPTPGSVLSGSSVAFTWTAGGGPSAYQLYLGTTGVGSHNLYESGATTATTVTVSTLPTAGVTVYARLWWLIGATWSSADYTYTEAGTPVLPVLTTPAPGSTLAGSSVAFTWTAGAGPAAYQLYVGTTGVGSHNLYESGATTATTVTVSDLPTNGVTVYVRLWWEIDAVWKSADYTYTAQ